MPPPSQVLMNGAWSLVRLAQDHEGHPWAWKDALLARCPFNGLSRVNETARRLDARPGMRAQDLITALVGG